MITALRALLNRQPRLKARLERLRYQLFPRDSVSTAYREIPAQDLKRDLAALRGAWQVPVLPERQRGLVDKQLQLYRQGGAVDVFDVFVRALQMLPGLGDEARLLEIGCSSGFYAEVMQIADIPFDYTGCDYAENFIALARMSYPQGHFHVADATALPYADGAFDVTVSGCCLLHIPEYAQAVAETARVTRQFVVFHRTPVLLGQPTKHYRKLAYGVETVEIHFDEDEFLELLAHNRLQLLDTLTISEQRDAVNSRHGKASRTYICRKLAP